MKRTYKLYDIIKTFSDPEVRQLRKLLRSPFFVMREDVKRLFGYLAQCSMKGKEMPALEVVFKKTFPGEPYHALRLRGTMSDLLGLIEEFLVISFRREDKLKTRLLLSAIYRRRHLGKCYHSNIKKTRQLLEGHPKRNGEYYQHVLGLQMENMKFQIASKRTEHLYFQEISETNDVLYLIQKLQNACAQLSHQSVYKTDYDYGLLKHFIDEIENERYMKIPAIAIYYYCFRFMTEKDSLAYFQKFKTQLAHYKDQFTVEDLQGPYRLGINFCIRKLNEGDSLYIREGWELYKEGLGEGILLQNNLITRFTFNNMVAIALLLNEFDWVEDFIKTSAEKLEETFREQTVSFNIARLHFAKKNYGEALIHLQSAEYNDLVNILISKMLLVKIYFELEEFDSLAFQLDSFQQFIRRREVSDYHRTNYLNIIRFVKKISALATYDKVEKEKLKREITKEPNLTERAWLLEKLN